MTKTGQGLDMNTNILIISEIFYWALKIPLKKRVKFYFGKSLYTFYDSPFVSSVISSSLVVSVLRSKTIGSPVTSPADSV